MLVSKHKVVALTYELRLDNETGQFVEKTTDEKPLVFLCGVGQMLPDFETNLEGLKVNDTFAFGIVSEKAYGTINPEAVVDLPKAAFVIDGKLADDLLVVGKSIPMRSQDGHVMRGTVIELGTDTVKLDFNHPMAGKDLYFTGKIQSIRDAQEEEVQHGHVHGPGGHHH